MLQRQFQSGSFRELEHWFLQNLESMDVQFDSEVLSYDGNTAYDQMFYRLQAEAAHHWQKTYGFVPTPGELMNAFFAAEFERFRRARLANRRWYSKLGDWLKSAKTGHMSVWLGAGNALYVHKFWEPLL